MSLVFGYAKPLTTKIHRSEDSEKSGQDRI